MTDDKKLFYLSLLNDYTLSHIVLLKHFSQNHFDPDDDVVKGSMVTVYKNIGATEKPMKGIIECIPEFSDDTAFVKHLTERLVSDSLVQLIDFEMPVSKENARAKKTTKYGDEFLSFIENYT